MYVRTVYLNRDYLFAQVSAVSNAYTVKSLPGAYLYIPLMGSASGGPTALDCGGLISGDGSRSAHSSLTSVRRSQSDPEIHFSPPFGHQIILTVPSNDGSGRSDFFIYETYHVLMIYRFTILLSSNLEGRQLVITCEHRILYVRTYST